MLIECPIECPYCGGQSSTRQRFRPEVPGVSESNTRRGGSAPSESAERVDGHKREEIDASEAAVISGCDERLRGSVREAELRIARSLVDRGTEEVA